MIKICKKCGNEFEYINSYFKNTCEKCLQKIRSKGGINSQKILKKKNLCFYNPETGRKGGHNAQKTLKKENKSFYNVENQRKNGKIGGKKVHELHPNQAKEFGKKHGHKGGINSQKVLKEKNLGFYNSNTQSENGKKGGLKSQKIQRQSSLYVFMKAHYDSDKEQEIAMDLFYQYNIKLKEGVTCHVQMKGGEIDFLVKKYKCFIEQVHNCGYKTYYKKRRKLLDKNGYKNYKLIIIKT